MKTLSLIFALTVATSAHAGQERGGGLITGLEANTSAQAALFEISQNPALGQLTHYAELEALMKTVKVVGVTDPLPVRVNNLVQYSTAVNDKASDTISVNEDLWNAVQDPRPRKALMLHELESLLGYESTGVYTISGAYLALSGFTDALGPLALHAAASPNRPQGFDLTQYGTMDCEYSSCSVQVPAAPVKNNKAACQSAFKVVYAEFLRIGKIITDTAPCYEVVAVRRPPNGGPDYEVNTGVYVGRISFK